MRSICRLVLVSTLACGSFACSRASPTLTEAHSVAIRDSVAAAMEAFRHFSASAQWDSLASLYSEVPGFRFAESGELRYRSARELRAALASIPHGTRIRTSFRDVEIDPLAPGFAAVSTLFETSFVDSSGANLVAYGGAMTMLWSHENGQWRIRQGHSSAPLPRGR